MILKFGYLLENQMIQPELDNYYLLSLTDSLEYSIIHIGNFSRMTTSKLLFERQSTQKHLVSTVLSIDVSLQMKEFL